MDQTPLVEQDIEAGRKLLQALDSDNKFSVGTAFWLFREESGEYRLILSSPIVNDRGPDIAYAALAWALVRSDLDRSLPLHRIEAISVDDPLAVAVRKLARTGRRQKSNMRLRNNLMNGILISDAYVYRAA